MLTQNMMRPAGPQTDTGTIIEPQTSPSGLLLRHLQPLPPPDPFHPLVVHVPTFCTEQRRHPAIAITAVLTSQNAMIAAVNGPASSTMIGL